MNITDWREYDQMMEKREQDEFIIMTEAEKHYRQAVANYEATKRERQSFSQGIEEKLKGMEQSGLYTAQKDHGTWNTIR